MLKLMITFAILSVFSTTNVFALKKDNVKDEKTCELFQIIETDCINTSFLKSKDDEKYKEPINIFNDDEVYKKSTNVFNDDEIYKNANILNEDLLVMPGLKFEVPSFEVKIPELGSVILQKEEERTANKQNSISTNKNKENKLIDSIISEGVKQIGKPYVYGATGVDSFDCSMLVKHSFESKGISFPRTSREQRAFTKYISFDELKRGDFVFWHEGTVLTHENVRHVAIYLGEGKMLQATPPEVVISNVVRGKQGKYNISYGRYDYFKHTNNIW